MCSGEDENCIREGGNACFKFNDLLWAGGEESGAMRHRQARVGCTTQEMMPGRLRLQCDCFEGERTGVFENRVFSKTPVLSGPAGTRLNPYL